MKFVIQDLAAESLIDKAYNQKTFLKKYPTLINFGIRDEEHKVIIELKSLEDLIKLNQITKCDCIILNPLENDYATIQIILQSEFQKKC